MGQDYEKTSFGGRLVGSDRSEQRGSAADRNPCPYGGDPYKNYACLDPYLGTDFFSRFINYYRLEWGHEAAPADPKAPPSRRRDRSWPATPQSTPPMPFTEWPYGGTTNLGVTRPSSVDSPLMAATRQYGRLASG